jgi:hypothetical protein
VDPVTLGGGTDYDFVVAFAGNHLLGHGSLDSNDILITGPNGFSQKASLLQVMPGGFTTWAQYRIAAPGGSWDVSDNGTYAVSILPDAIFDNSGNALQAGVLGTFNVNVPLPGDANRDGVVNSDDFQIVRANFGKNQMTWDTGDFNADGVVSFPDFQILEANFGKTLSPAPAAAEQSAQLVATRPRRPAPVAKPARTRLLN